ncbi:hypothetical protein GGI08_009313 [Coemansia sp. S2]|nr:hypothetical protein GGI08_009313 [Coemansia sp. S2]KAJ2327709.1 hypothetical protein GGH92_010002 [Coemansia sp. RSA 2673]
MDTVAPEATMSSLASGRPATLRPCTRNNPYSMYQLHPHRRSTTLRHSQAHKRQGRPCITCPDIYPTTIQLNSVSNQPTLLAALLASDTPSRVESGVRRHATTATEERPGAYAMSLLMALFDATTA